MTEALENQVKSKVTIKVNFLFYFFLFQIEFMLLLNSDYGSGSVVVIFYFFYEINLMQYSPIYSNIFHVIDENIENYNYLRFFSQKKKNLRF